MAHSDAIRQKAYSLFLKGASIPAILKELGIGRRTVERWRKAGNWDAAIALPGETQKVDQAIEDREIAAQTAESNVVDLRRDRPRRERRTMSRIDEVLIIEDAIESLSDLLARDNISVNSPGVGSTASALVRLLEYRRKISPPTATELAEAAIAHGIAPEDFITELQKQWRLRA